MLCSVNPYLCPILGVCALQAEAWIGRCTMIVLLKFNGCGAAFSVSEFLGFRKYIIAITVKRLKILERREVCESFIAYFSGQCCKWKIRRTDHVCETSASFYWHIFSVADKDAKGKYISLNTQLCSTFRRKPTHLTCTSTHANYLFFSTCQRGFPAATSNFSINTSCSISQSSESIAKRVYINICKHWNPLISRRGIQSVLGKEKYNLKVIHKKRVMAAPKKIKHGCCCWTRRGAC
jgi:hypothetical protein